MQIPRTVHMVGAGGSGMSSLAHVLLDAGAAVTGSDKTDNDAVRALRARGARIAVGHHEANLPAGVEVCVRSAAVPDDNPEVAAARARDVPVRKYAEMVGRLMEDRRGVAVSGCHGKTTTTSMIAWIFDRAGLDPAFVCGGIVRQFGRGGRWTNGRFMVAEACEYDRSFLRMKPEAAVITNIEADHLDYYGSLDEIVEAFRAFASGAQVVFASRDCPRASAVARERKGETFGLAPDADWRARAVSESPEGTRFEALRYGKPFGTFTLRVPGVHNVHNALGAIAVAAWAGVGHELIQLALSEFEGAARRFEVLGERNGVVVVDDYGHHPTEVAATLRAVRARFPGRKVWCVFQPHQRSRTRILLKEFARAFADADVVLLPEIYDARDAPEDAPISSQALVPLLDEAGKAALYLPTLDEVLAFVRSKVGPGCVLLTMGAGNVNEVARRFLAEPGD